MRLLILGGDGYLGWPTAMYLSRMGHDVSLVDNYFRRQACLELDIEPLFPVPSLPERAEIWQKVSGCELKVFIGDAANYPFLLDVFNKIKPDAVIHYAEQPSAPYSMLGQKEAIFTIQNNLTTTVNLVFAVREVNPKCHIVKLGTMGEYGTPNIDIEEGYIEIEHKGRKDRFLYPRQAGSLYHTTKIQDTDLLYFYVRTWGIRVTDLMQGPVYGIFTNEMQGDLRLSTYFNYDEIFGTVLNRFVVQAAVGIPLTVYGKGGQTRGFLNLKDTLQCINLAINNPPETGELRVFNQFTEAFSVNELADKVRIAGKKINLDVKVQNVKNPRKEKEEHYYNPVHKGLPELGLKPNLLTEDVLIEMMEAALNHKHRIRIKGIMPKTAWA